MWQQMCTELTFHEFGTKSRGKAECVLKSSFDCVFHLTNKQRMEFGVFLRGEERVKGMAGGVGLKIGE